VLLISAQVQSKSGAPLVKAVPFAVFAGLERAVGVVTGGLAGLWTHYIGLVGATRNNEALTQRVAELEVALQAERATAEEARGLQRLLQFRETVPLSTLPARVVAGDPSPDALTITIDRGSADGVRADMAVLAPDGVVGRVINRPTAHAAQVQLLTGQAAAAGATLERLSAGGVVKGGMGDPPLRMDWVANTKDVRSGDRVLTSGQDGIFPAGFLIGTVERAERANGLFRAVAIRPAVDFSHVTLVLVVLDAPGRADPAAAGGGRS